MSDINSQLNNRHSSALCSLYLLLLISSHVISPISYRLDQKHPEKFSNGGLFNSNFPSALCLYENKKNNYWLFCKLLVAARSIHTDAVRRTKSVLKEQSCTRISWLKTDNVSWTKDVLYERTWLKHFTVLLVNRSKTPDYDVTPWRMKLTSTFILLLKGQHSVRICTFIILACVFH